jgi:hypothetical protein
VGGEDSYPLLPPWDPGGGEGGSGGDGDLLIRETVLRAVGTLLNATGKPTGSTVERNRTSPLRGTAVKHIHLVDHPLDTKQRAEEVDEKEGGDQRLVKRTLTFCVICTAAGSSSVTATTTVAELCAWVTAQLAGKLVLTRTTKVRELGTTNVTGIQEDVPFAQSAIEFRVTYVTLETNAESNGST